jgi:RNA polymerase sigma-70 factor (ECF subfamily)
MTTTNPQLVVHDGGGSPAATASEPELVARARQGEMQAWGVLYQAYFPRIYRHVRFMVGSQPGAEDLVQESFARALVRLPEFDGRSSFSTWLHGIAVNVVRNHWRSRRNTENAHARLRTINAARDAGTMPGMDHAHLCKRKAEVVYAILETLPEHIREAFILRDLEGCSPAEAAAQLGISPGNLSVRASRARERIRRELERMGWMTPRGGNG